jgi:hypothetical protein
MQYILPSRVCEYCSRPGLVDEERESGLVQIVSTLCFFFQPLEFNFIKKVVATYLLSRRYEKTLSSSVSLTRCPVLVSTQPMPEHSTHTRPP